MFGWLETIIQKIKSLNLSVNQYKEDTVVQSLPSFAHVNKAKKLIEKGELEKAKQTLIKAMEFPNKDALVYKYLGIIYDKEKKFDKAVAAYQISADWNPQDKIIWQKLGFALIAVGKYENAEKSFDNANRIAPGNTDTYTGWGMALMKQKKYDEAREKFSTAVKINRYNFSAMFLNAVMDMKLFDYDKAEVKLTFLANVCPNETNTYELAHLKSIKGDIESAIHYALKSVDYNPNMLPAYLLLAQLYSLKFDFETAEKYLKIAENRDLKAATLYIEWAKVLEKFDYFEAAKEKLNKVFEFEHDNKEANIHLALCNASLGQVEECRNIINLFTEDDLNNRYIKTAIGIVEYYSENPESAIDKLKQGLDDETDDSLNYYYLAKCYEKLNNETKVKDNYETAIMKNPKYLKAFIDYSKYLIKKSDYAEAQRKLRKALKAFSDNVELLNLLFCVNYTLVKENLCEYNIKETIAIAQKIEEINPDLFEHPEKKVELSEILNSQIEKKE